jgi:hypothetical protein
LFLLRSLPYDLIRTPHGMPLCPKASSIGTPASSAPATPAALRCPCPSDRRLQRLCAQMPQRPWDLGLQVFLILWHWKPCVLCWQTIGQRSRAYTKQLCIILV